MPVTLQTMQKLNAKLQELRSFGSRSSGISSYSYYRPSSYSYGGYGGYHSYVYIGGGGYSYGHGGHLSTSGAIGIIVFILVLFCCIAACRANGSDEEGEIVTVTQTDNVDSLIRLAKAQPISAHCKAGHGMRWCNFNPYRSEGILCDNCNMALNDNQYFHHCFECESDFCKNCGPQQRPAYGQQQPQVYPVHQQNPQVYPVHA